VKTSAERFGELQKTDLPRCEKHETADAQYGPAQWLPMAMAILWLRILISCPPPSSQQRYQIGLRKAASAEEFYWL